MAGGLSPMMGHYLEVKEKYKDCVVFYRLGDFYEMFFEDAVEVSALLDLTLTGRDCGLKERAPMCGIPYHAAETYISKLVALGKKVAICEQLSDPATTKGMVERGVIRVISAGTLIEDSLLDEKRNNFIACCYKSGEVCAVAWADITTGGFSAELFKGERSVDLLLEDLVKIAPAEVIVNDEFFLASKNNGHVRSGNLPAFSCYVPWAFGLRRAEKNLLDQFGTKTLIPYGIADCSEVVSAAGALIEYLKETQMHALKNIDGIKLVNKEKLMMLDGSAVKNLELVKTLGTGKKTGSLLWLLDDTHTAMGARLMNSLVLNPLRNKEEILYRQNGVAELFDATVVRAGLCDVLKGIRDIERIAGKISNDNLNPRDCVNLGESLAAVPNIKILLSGFISPVLNEISVSLGDFSGLANLLSSAFIENPPISVKDGGYIRKGYSKELDELRSVRDNGARMIAELEAKEREETGIKNLKIKYNRVFGYSIEVTNSFKDKVPYRYQRRQTLANAERYVTDELKDLEVRILSGEQKSLSLEVSLFGEIKSVLADNIAGLKQLSSAIALLDCLLAFACVSKERGYCKPEIVDAGEEMAIREGRHPVVEALSKERFVPNDAVFDDESRTMVITGPNMAGKSTYMRQTALIAIMAHLGCYVPARSAKIPVIDSVFTRVGASDNLILDQSTFMVEMTEVASIILNATPNSLLILDEVGRGTSTYDGLSIAWAVLEYLTKKIRAKTMFSTHYHELTELEDKIDGIKNYKVTVKESGGSVIFLRKIVRGGTNKSFGIEVAKLAGVPNEVTVRAKEILARLEKNDIAAEGVNRVKSEEPTATKDELKEFLCGLDTDNLTPMQAFGILCELSEKAKEKV